MSVSTTLVLAGRLMNNLGRARSVTPTSENSLFPIANLYDGWPGIEFRFGSAAANVSIVADLALYAGGGFEEATVAAAGWTAGVGTPTRSTAQHHSGAASALLNDTETAYRDVTVRAGEQCVAACWALSAASGSGKVYIQNLATGKWLASNRTWQASPTVHGSGFQTYWQQIAGTTLEGGLPTPLPFAVESVAECGGPTAILRITILADGGDVYFDDVDIWPASTFASIHGHNLDPKIVATIAFSDDASSYTTAATFTLYPRSFYTTFDQVNKRYCKLLFTGTNSAAIRLGEAVVGQGLQLATGCRWPVPMRYRMRQDVAHGYVYSLDDEPPRSVRLDFKHLSSAAYVEYRDELALRARGARWPVVVVPAPAARPDFVLFGRAALQWEDQYGPGAAVYRTVLDLDESPLAAGVA